MMELIASPPHLTASEFHAACTSLVNSFDAIQNTPKKTKWLDASLDPDEHMLRITKELHVNIPIPQGLHPQDVPELNEDDDERLASAINNAPLILFDVLFSPSYTVPVLYFHVSDTLHRYPPSMDTLYTHIVAPEYIDQTKDVGVLGGITVTVFLIAYFLGMPDDISELDH